MSRCVDCAHGPRPYDVQRRCPKLNRLVKETSPACEHFEKWVPGEDFEDERGKDETLDS